MFLDVIPEWLLHKLANKQASEVCRVTEYSSICSVGVLTVIETRNMWRTKAKILTV